MISSLKLIVIKGFLILKINLRKIFLTEAVLEKKLNYSEALLSRAAIATWLYLMHIKPLYVIMTQDTPGRQIICFLQNSQLICR